MRPNKLIIGFESLPLVAKHHTFSKWPSTVSNTFFAGPNSQRFSLHLTAPTKTLLIQRAEGTWVITPTRLNVTIRMDTPNSWVVSGRQSAALLAHEQGHYKITALGARDCHTDILAIVGDSAGDVQSQVNSIVSSAQSLIASVNDLYDEDPNCGTDHGSDSSAQAQWNLKIRNAMNSPTARLADLNVCSGTSP
jgi:hypothetical protein